MIYDFTERRVLVTGGTSGIGAAIAAAFAAAGATVTITGTRAEDAYAPLAGKMRHMQLRLGDRTDVAAIAAECDRLDILINNAGGTTVPEDFDAAIDANLKGVHALTVALLPAIERSEMVGGGSVISIASMMAVFGNSVFPGYSAAKAGLLLMTRSLAEGWGGRGVRINAIAPGPVRTPMTKRYADDPAIGPGTAARMALRRWGQPEEIAGPALFLASPAAAFITGECLVVSGGYLIAEA
jgi:3-oxoacyl-[acyl-carrier protein] reductase